MNSHNAKADLVVKIESVQIGFDEDEVRVLKSDLVKAPELSISDDYDTGSDPYNSTGTHVIIPEKSDDDA